MTSPYALPGLEIAQMRGGEATLLRVLGELTKETPSHVSIVGPRYFGKSVLMHQLLLALRKNESAYHLVCTWDLRHQTPTDDSDFVRQLARKVDEALLARGVSSYHEYLAASNASFAEISDNLRLVVESLQADGMRAVVLLDDFDRLGQESATTANLWNYLRGLAQHPNFRFVTTSRRRLRDVIAGKESRASDFWNIFGDPVLLKPNTEADLVAWLKPLEAQGFTFDKDVGRDVLIWSGGVPVLMAALLDLIFVSAPVRRLTKGDVDVAGENARDRTQDFLRDLWDDCPSETRRDLCEIAARGEMAAASLSPARCDVLIDRGYVRREGSRIKLACQLMQRFAAVNDALAADLVDWFKDPSSELRTFKRILTIKLENVKGGDPDLRHDIRIAIESLEVGTCSPLRLFRGIAEQAVTLAWAAEFPTGQVPAEVQVALTQPPKKAPLYELGTQHEIGSRRTILRRAVGGNQNAPKLTKKLTRPAMLLIDHMHALGNYGQHAKQFGPDVENPVDEMFCAYGCLSALMLFARLAQDVG